MVDTRTRSSFPVLLLATLVFTLAGCVGDPPDGPHLNPNGNNPDGGRPDGGPNGNPDGGPNGNPDGGPNGTGCGNLSISAGEACDDGNRVGGDGCAADCKAVESGWFCNVAGQPCVRNTCGDGRVYAAEEECDDRNTASNDGCSAQCTKEAGWDCQPGGGRCFALECGDGIVAGDEECEDNDTTPTSGDGCSATCLLERGYKCPTAGQACQTTRCGDSIVEGTEQCDDGDNDMGDGCSPLCVKEPDCDNGTCVEVCGDGVLLPDGVATEQCDDGNLRDNDGCSSLCRFEPGFNCKNEGAEPASVEIPVVYRDFRGWDLPANAPLPRGHEDFENENGHEKGLVGTQLGADGKPVYTGTVCADGCTTHGKDAFDQWYRDDHANHVNRTVVETLTLQRQGATGAVYVFDDQTFFPLDNRGWVAEGKESHRNGHNFSFTSEVRYWFEYKGTEVLTFRGDDDVWVFINGRLALDLGGVHGATDGTVDLTHAPTVTALGLQQKRTYEAVVFQAERHTTASSYRLTLSNFSARRTTCINTCGDNVVQAPEECDNGTNPGGYGQCAPGCIWGPRCGDGVTQEAAGEQCDDGNQNNFDSCSNTCQVILG